MAYFRIEYYSNALHRSTGFEMLIPNDYRLDLPVQDASPISDTPMGTLFLLHGYTGKAGNWVPEELAAKYNFAIVMPTAENSFYLDGEATGRMNGNAIRGADIKGGSARLELGATMKPDKAPWSLDLNVTGFAGKKQGVMGGVSFAWLF